MGRGEGERGLSTGRESTDVGSARVVETDDRTKLYLAAEAGERQRITRTATGLQRALDFLKIELRYNVRGARHEWREAGGEWSGGAEGADQIDADIVERIAERCVVGKKNAPALFGAETWKRCRNALLRYQHVDPFVAWLNALPEHDGVPRIGDWLHECFITDESLLTRWGSAFVFLGAVERTLEPGCKLEEMPILIGDQGIAKSTALRFTLPHGEQGDAWFSDSLQLAAPDQERAEALRNHVIVEVSEMAGSGRAELASLKAFLSRQAEKNRLSYRANPEHIPRRCILVGTTNEVECLPNDPTGNRRFVAVHVEERHGGVGAVRGYLDANRDQLWRRRSPSTGPAPGRDCRTISRARRPT